MPEFDVLVVGSLHFDVMFEAPRLPAPDETLMGRAAGFKCGGKGGNQAVAAARAGARTAMIGRVGKDYFGDRLIANLHDHGVDCHGVAVDAGEVTGLSTAVVDLTGAYSAVVASGANLRIDVGGTPLPAAKVLLLQNEIPEAANLAAAAAGRSGGAIVVLNAAPACPLSANLEHAVDILIVNRVEAGMMVARSIDGLAAAEDACQELLARFPNVIVTLGGDGLVMSGRDIPMTSIAAEPVTVVSTHGAGDVFCGTLVAQLAAGAALEAATRAASKAAARHVAGG